MSDVEIWIDSNGDGVCDTKLSRPWNVSYSKRHLKDGDAAFTLTNDDAQSSLAVPLRRCAIVHTATGTVLWSGRIHRTNEIVVNSGEHAGMNTVYSLRDDLADYEAHIVTPWLYFENTYKNDLSQRPIDSERHMGWRDPNYFAVMASLDGGGPGVPTYYSPGHDGFTWTPGYPLYAVGNQAASPSGRNGNPQTFPQPDVVWIYTRGISGGLHPQGDVWLHGWCATPADCPGFVFYMAGDDAYEVWLNGTLLAAVDNDEADSAFLQTKRVVVNRTSEQMGPLMFFMVRVRNQGPNVAGDVGGFIMLCRKKGTSELVYKTDHTWYGLDYPATTIPASPVPGMPAGFLWGIFKGEHEARLTATGQTSALTAWTHLFSDLEDSDGNSYPLFADLPIPNGTHLLGVLELMSTKIDFDYVPRKGLPQLKMWGGEGVRLIDGTTGVGKGTTKAITFEKGVNAMEITVEETVSGAQWNEGYANTLVYTWRDGWGEVATAAVGAGTEKRIERFYAFGADIEKTEVDQTISLMLDLMSSTNRTYTVQPAPISGVIPGVDFDTGDRVSIDVGDVVTEKVITITGQVDDNGNLVNTIEVGKDRDVIERKYEQFMASVAKGAEFTRGAPQPSPFYVGEFINQSDVEYTLPFFTPTETTTDTNPIEASVAGRVMFLDIRADLPLADDCTVQVSINGVASESVTLNAGDLYVYATFNSGTDVPKKGVITATWTCADTEARATATLRLGEVV